MNISEDVLAEKLLAVATPIMVSQRCSADDAIKKARELFEKCQQAAKTMLTPLSASRDHQHREVEASRQPERDEGAGSNEQYNDQQELARRAIIRPQTANNSTARERGFAAAVRQTERYKD